MTLPSVVDVPAPDDSAGRPTGWHQVLELTRLICALAILLSAFAQDSVRYWVRQANGPVLTYRRRSGG